MDTHAVQQHSYSIVSIKRLFPTFDPLPSNACPFATRAFRHIAPHPIRTKLRMSPSTFDYNTQRPRLPIPEYGRHVQRMVDHVMEMEDREQRTRQAKAIIQVIGRLNPQLRSSDNFERILWDHLWIMSDLKLDVDAPYPMPTAEDLESKPQPVPYPQTKIKFGHYGKMVERMITQCAAMEAGDKRDAYAELIANQMKKQFLTWNRDTVPDPVILKDMAELSKGQLKLKDDVQLAHTADLLRTNQSGPRNQVDTRKRHNSGGGSSSSSSSSNGGSSSSNNKKRNRSRKKRY